MSSFPDKSEPAGTMRTPAEIVAGEMVSFSFVPTKSAMTDSSVTLKTDLGQ